jgi:hypothetical protein
MNRIALVGLALLGAACDLPLFMVEIEVPETCITRVVDVEMTTPFLGVDGYDELPSEMAVNLSGQLGTEIELEDQLVELPEEARDLLDLDVRIKLVRVTPLAPHADALDGFASLSLVVNPPDGSGLAPKTILAFERDPLTTPSGTPVEASGDEINLAEYLYAGQLTFDYSLVATVTLVEPWQAEVTTCVSTRGKVEVSIEDIQGEL